MPFVLIVVGITLLFAAINNTEKQLFALVQGDFSGASSFINWLFAIAVVGGAGYVPGLRPISHAFLGLIIVVLILHQDPTKLFGGITDALAGSAGGPIPPGSQPSTPLPELPTLPGLSTGNGPSIFNAITNNW